MRFLDIIQDVEDISLVTDKRDMTKRAINHSLERVVQHFDFPWYIQDKGVIRTYSPYSTGTADVVLGSDHITGTPATPPVWTADMVGKKIRVASDAAFYRIKSFTDPTHLVLEQPYQQATGTSQGYKIYQDEYRLAPDVDKYKGMRQTKNRIPLFIAHPAQLDASFPMPYAYADPIMEAMEGTLLDTETTGTVEGVVNTTTLTGTTTTWTLVEGLGRLSEITIGNYSYRIKSVDSDTQITLYDKLQESVVAGTTFVIHLTNLRVQVYPIPDNSRLLYYRYFRRPTPLVNDYDVPDMPPGFDSVLIYGALSKMYLQKGDMTKAFEFCEAQFLKLLDEMKLKVGSFAPDRLYHRRTVDRWTRGINDGLEQSSFDRRYSSP